MNTIHRILTGQTETGHQLRAAGYFFLAWAAWDVGLGCIQLYDRAYPAPVKCDMIFPHSVITGGGGRIEPAKQDAEIVQPKFSAATSIPGWYFEFMLDAKSQQAEPSHGPHD